MGLLPCVDVGVLAQFGGGKEPLAACIARVRAFHMDQRVFLQAVFVPVPALADLALLPALCVAPHMLGEVGLATEALGAVVASQVAQAVSVVQVSDHVGLLLEVLAAHVAHELHSQFVGFHMEKKSIF